MKKAVTFIRFVFAAFLEWMLSFKHHEMTPTAYCITRALHHCTYMQVADGVLKFRGDGLTVTFTLLEQEQTAFLQVVGDGYRETTFSFLEGKLANPEEFSVEHLGSFMLLYRKLCKEYKAIGKAASP